MSRYNFFTTWRKTLSQTHTHSRALECSVHTQQTTNHNHSWSYYQRRPDRLSHWCNDASWWGTRCHEVVSSPTSLQNIYQNQLLLSLLHWNQTVNVMFQHIVVFSEDAVYNVPLLDEYFNPNVAIQVICWKVLYFFALQYLLLKLVFFQHHAVI